MVNKIYFDSYKKDFSGGLSTYPDVKTNLQKQLKNGLLLINYTGHGNTVSWSDEKVLTESDITKSTYTRLPVWITATCDFCRFDAPVTSAGEQVFLNKVSGGIGLFTTTRVAYSSPNFSINDNLFFSDFFHVFIDFNTSRNLRFFPAFSCKFFRKMPDVEVHRTHIFSDRSDGTMDLLL